jgi:hypothetical protein
VNVSVNLLIDISLKIQNSTQSAEHKGIWETFSLFVKPEFCSDKNTSINPWTPDLRLVNFLGSSNLKKLEENLDPANNQAIRVV